jgi:hypothetical protein
MTVKFRHGRVLLTADTPEEAARMMALLKKQDEEAARERAPSRVLAGYGGPVTQLRQFIVDEAETPWTPDIFLDFIGRLGPAQKRALALLVTRRRVTDEELRKALKVSGNQALAGVLSGISKQAAALKIPARAIFSFENLRNAGKRRSAYAVADKFLQIATDMNWPAPTEK